MKNADWKKERSCKKEFFFLQNEVCDYEKENKKNIIKNCDFNEMER